MFGRDEIMGACDNTVEGDKHIYSFQPKQFG